LDIPSDGGMKRTCVTNACVVDLYSDFVSLGRLDLDILDGKIFASFPSYGSL